MDRLHPDFLKARAMVTLFGGYFGSRLMSNVREENGYTYHISAEVDAYGKRNAFMISSETANEYVELCIKEIYLRNISVSDPLKSWLNLTLSWMYFIINTIAVLKSTIVDNWKSAVVSIAALFFFELFLGFSPILDT